MGNTWLAWHPNLAILVVVFQEPQRKDKNIPWRHIFFLYVALKLTSTYIINMNALYKIVALCAILLSPSSVIGNQPLVVPHTTGEISSVHSRQSDDALPAADPALVSFQQQVAWLLITSNKPPEPVPGKNSVGGYGGYIAERSKHKDKASYYISFSKRIVRSLSIKKLIFPFHSFL